MSKNFNIKNRNYFFSILMAFTSCMLLFNSFVYADTNDILYSNVYKTIELSGKINNPTKKDNYVSITVQKEDKLLYVGQIPLNDDGSYKYSFSMRNNADDIENATIRIKQNNQDITSSLIGAVMLDKKMIGLSSDYYIGEEYIDVYSDITELYKVTDDFVIVIAQYSSDGAMLGTDVLSNESVQFDNNVSYIDTQIECAEGAKKVKVFMWQSVKEMLPVSRIVDESGLVISFDDKTDSQVANGYKALEGNTNFERYQSAVSELPEEIGVMEPVYVHSKNIFYVSPDGDDNNDGTIAAPFETIEKAIEVYKALPEEKSRYWTTIYLRGGKYNINQTIDISSDSDSHGKLYISAYRDEKPILANSDSIPISCFTKIEQGDADYERIPDRAKGKVYYCNYSDVGVSKMSDYTFKDGADTSALYFGDDKFKVARYPNAKLDNIETALDDGVTEENTVDEFFEFIPKDKSVLSWKDTGDVSIYGKISVTWMASNAKVSINPQTQSIKGPAEGNVWYGSVTQIYPISGICTNLGSAASFYYYNALEALDIPNEWCYDDTTDRFYVYITDKMSEENESFNFDSRKNDVFFSVNDVSDVVFNGVEFTVGNRAIDVTRSDSVVIQNCDFSNITGDAVKINRCKKSGVINSFFRNLGGGVNLVNDIARCNDLEPQRNFVQNCHFNNLRNTAVNISCEIGDIISHNTLENSMGAFVYIYISSENVIEYNDAYACARWGNESSIIYIEGHFDTRNNHIRYNYLHDILPEGKIAGTGGAISLDDMENHDFIYNNIIARMSGTAGSNAGDNNIFDSNVLIDCGNGITTDEYMYEGSFFDTALLRDPTCPFMYGYVYFKRYESDAWNNRYNEIQNEYSFLNKVRDMWISKYSDVSKDITRGDDDPDAYFLKASTGNYFINNIFANGENEKSPSSFGKRGYDFLQTTDPQNGVSQYEGMDYNVEYNNQTADSFDVEGLDYFDKIGCRLSDDEMYRSGNKINVVYPENKSITENKNVDIFWENCDRANYYKVYISTDSSFENDVYALTSLENVVSAEVKRSSAKDLVYYYKIEGYSSKHGVSAPVAVSDIKEFTLLINPEDDINSYLLKDWEGINGESFDYTDKLDNTELYDNNAVRTLNAYAKTVTENDNTFVKISTLGVNDGGSSVGLIKNGIRISPSDNMYKKLNFIEECDFYLPSAIAGETSAGKKSFNIGIIGHVFNKPWLVANMTVYGDGVAANTVNIKPLAEGSKSSQLLYSSDEIRQLTTNTWHNIKYVFYYDTMKSDVGATIKVFIDDEYFFTCTPVTSNYYYFSKFEALGDEYIEHLGIKAWTAENKNISAAYFDNVKAYQLENVFSVNPSYDTAEKKLLLDFSNVIDNPGSVKITDKQTGMEIASTYSAGKTNGEIKITEEAFDISKEYVLSFTDTRDIYGQALTTATINFKSADE